eukprot:UC1_evm2s2093
MMQDNLSNLRCTTTALLVAVVVGTAVLATTAVRGEPLVEAQNGNLTLSVDASQDIVLARGDEVTTVNALVAELASLRSQVNTLSAAVAGVHRDSKVVEWVSHKKTGQDSNGYISVGTAHTDEVLHIDVTDSGCNSGIGLAFDVSANWGVDRGQEPQVHPRGNSHSGLAQRFKFYYKSIDQTTYQLFLVITGWANACNNQLEQPHQATVTVQASGSRFELDKSNTLRWDSTGYKLAPVSRSGYTVSTKTSVYKTHYADESKRASYISLGRAHVEQALKVDITDSGCGSSQAFSYQIVAKWGVATTTSSHPQAFTLGAANLGAQKGYNIYWSPSGQSRYNLYLKVDGHGPCGSQEGVEHTLISSIAAPDDRFLDQVSVEWDPTDANSGVRKMDMVNFQEELAGSKSTVDTIIYDAHDPDPEKRQGEFNIGVMDVAEILHIDISDTGCFSGIGLSIVLSSTYGIKKYDHLFQPTAYIFTTPHVNHLDDRFVLMYKALNEAQYQVFLRVQGWAPCASQSHELRITTQSSGPKFTYKSARAPYDDATYSPVTEVRMADVVDLVPAPGQLAGWKPLRASDIAGVSTTNTRIEIVDVAIGTMKITSTALERGCGNGAGSSDLIIFHGAWSKIRYTQTFYGRASCYGIFSSKKYHWPISGSKGGESVTVNGRDRMKALQTSATENGLSAFDPALDRTFFGQNLNVDGTVTQVPTTDTEMCSNENHFWQQFDKPRSVMVELRREALENPAGISTGTSCSELVSDGAASRGAYWEYSTLEVLYE